MVFIHIKLNVTHAMCNIPLSPTTITGPLVFLMLHIYKVVARNPPIYPNSALLLVIN